MIINNLYVRRGPAILLAIQSNPPFPGWHRNRFESWRPQWLLGKIALAARARVASSTTAALASNTL